MHRQDCERRKGWSLRRNRLQRVILYTALPVPACESRIWDYAGGRGAVGARVRIGSGTMYGAVSNMMKKGWIAECDAEPEYGTAGGSRNTGVRKKLYVLTDTGRQALEAELVRLIEMLKSAEKIIGRRLNFY